MILRTIKAKTLQVGAAGGEGTILWIQVARGQKNYDRRYFLLPGFHFDASPYNVDSWDPEMISEPIKW